MTMLFEELPAAIQTEIITRRQQMRDQGGWEQGTHATTAQWRTYYAMLSERAQEFIVSNLLEAAQQGSLCIQADHVDGLEASWNQLTEVVKLHNARVTEVEQLKLQVARLQEREAHPVHYVEPQLPEDTDFLPVQFPEGAAPKDRALYVVKTPPTVEDGD